MKHTNLPDEIEVTRGTDWISYLMSSIIAIVVLFMIISVATLIVDVATGMKLHEIIGNAI